MLYLVSYDISDTPRRTKISKTLLDYGTRVQYSVFECHLDDVELFQKMCRRLESIILEEEDSLRIYSVCGSCETVLRVRGTARRVEDPDIYIL